MIFSGESITAQRAHDLGIITQSNNVTLDTLALAQKIASQSIDLLQKSKQAIRSYHDLTPALDKEKEFFYSTFDLTVQKQKMLAFLEKKPLSYTNEHSKDR
jgi:enoyl-CoA hydratase/carnithine racemase